MRGLPSINVGALMIRVGFGVYYTIFIIRNPQSPILIIKAIKAPSISKRGPGLETTDKGTFKGSFEEFL